MSLHACFKKGILPSGGGWSEETSLYRQVMLAMSNLEDQASAWYHEAMKKNPPKGGR